MAVVPHESHAGPSEGQQVAFYYSRLASPGGGAERMVILLASEMAARGFAVHIVTWDEPDAVAFYPIPHTVIWHRLGARLESAGKVRRATALAGLLRRHSVKALVGFIMSGDVSIYLAARLAGVKLIVAERNAPDMYRYRYSALKRWHIFLLMRLADRITVQLPSFVEGYPRNLRKKIVAIPNPVPRTEATARPELAGPDGRFTLLAVSRIDSVQKRLSCLVGAFGRVANGFPDWQLRILGDGPDRAALVEQIQDLGISGRLRIEGTSQNVFDAYARSHLFVIPSRWEGFSNALAEAMSHGLPPIGFKEAAGVADLIGAAGWLACGADDEHSLATTLSVAMSDATERARRGALAAARIAEFDNARQSDRWTDLLLSMLPVRESA